MTAPFSKLWIRLLHSTGRPTCARSPMLCISDAGLPKIIHSRNTIAAFVAQGAQPPHAQCARNVSMSLVSLACQIEVQGCLWLIWSRNATSRTSRLCLLYTCLGYPSPMKEFGRWLIWCIVAAELHRDEKDLRLFSTETHMTSSGIENRAKPHEHKDAPDQDSCVGTVTSSLPSQLQGSWPVLRLNSL